MEHSSISELLWQGLSYALYFGMAALGVIALLLVSANLNKALLAYRDFSNKISARDRTMPPKIIACAGLAFMVGGLVPHEPIFVGAGIASLPLVFLSLRDLNRRDLFDKD